MKHYIEVWDAKARVWVREADGYPTATTAANVLHARQLTGARVVRVKESPVRLTPARSA